MGKTETQILLKGKLGPLIYYQMKGKQYVRTAPTKINYPNTAKQQQYKQRFALSSTLASAIYIKADGWFLETDDASQREYNQLKKRIQLTGLRESLEGWEYDFEALLLTEGSLPVLTFQIKDNKVTWNKPLDKFNKGIVYVVEIHKMSLKVNMYSTTVPIQQLEIPWDKDKAYYAFYSVKTGSKMKVSRSVRLEE